MGVYVSKKKGGKFCHVDREDSFDSGKPVTLRKAVKSSVFICSSLIQSRFIFSLRRRPNWPTSPRWCTSTRKSSSHSISDEGDWEETVPPGTKVFLSWLLPTPKSLSQSKQWNRYEAPIPLTDTKLCLIMQDP
ncbi:hypothetical protein F2Q70_00020435 [Brassica cretica]|uniref:Uncharacterized protein n=1 Tax=Brassica cretica TaxID=69181 RepID=A0A8S9L026_BRACR|nr:hypothetical protein F2Q70_00020435 [Brassica cretica]KAF2599532.1 hypothetical protein F2Q68_00007605 [Brassica cretica]